MPTEKATKPVFTRTESEITIEWKGKRVVVFFDKEDEYAVFFGQAGMGTMVTTNCPPDGRVTIWPHW